MQRRHFILGSTATAAALAARARAQPKPSPDAPVFTTRNAARQAAYDKALAVLAANVQVLPKFPGPVLIEGAEYAGIWQECAPQEGLVYRRFSREAARNNHLAFFALQRPDGQLPASNKRSDTGFGQIQMVVPIAATAWEIAQATGDEELLHTAYESCARWDAWLVRYRNTRGTGLVEGFCTYDTGHDNSPRWAGVVNRCPDADAKRWQEGQGTPRLCPDLSATVFGGRVALGKMARALGRQPESDHWAEKAETLRTLILDKLFVAQDAAFYDLDVNDQFIKIRGDVISRVCGEHVPSQALFEQIWAQQLHNPAAFWPRYPLPSIALDDPAFVRPIPRNSWGGASQALTALRAPRWMEFYNKPTELAQMMEAWSDALERDGTFRQQMDPESGIFTEGGSKGYSPAALVLVDFTWRLAGVRQEADRMDWNVRPQSRPAEGARFVLKTDSGLMAEMRYEKGGADLFLAGKKFARIDGTARLVTDLYGRGLEVVGTLPTEQTVKITRGKEVQNITIAPNERAKVRA